MAAQREVWVLRLPSPVCGPSAGPSSLRVPPDSPLVPGLLSQYVAPQHASMFSRSTSRSIMEVKERRPYCSLTKSRKDKEGPYTGSSGDSEDCVLSSQGLRVPTQKSYSSSETLKAFDQHQDQTRLLYGTTKGHKEMVRHDQDDYTRPAEGDALLNPGLLTPQRRIPEHECKDNVCSSNKVKSIVPLCLASLSDLSSEWMRSGCFLPPLDGYFRHSHDGDPSHFVGLSSHPSLGRKKSWIEQSITFS
ncbi:hypothetical protein WMY93_006134 [Mugilogobius chulae]|uniref:Teneurin N-terminal domain-containing protein n=1 Tax=Mugilogobius chulae TaxID=88201 RepID=A0AAW0PUP0_9GOBI